MSDAAPPTLGPDDQLLAERVQRLLEADRIDRQLRDLAQSRRNLTASRKTLQLRLDEIAAELRGRAAGRAQAAEAPKDTQ